MGFKGCTAVKIHIIVFWVISCSLEGGYQCFRGTYCFHCQIRSEDEGNCAPKRVGHTHQTHSPVI
jgi:hypothetical protein